MPGRGPTRRARQRARATRSTSAGSAVGGELAGERAADQPLGGLRLRRHRAEEARAAGVGDEQGREVLDVEVAERVGVVLDVDPGEVGVGAELRRQRGEGRAVFAARAAPLGAQARDQGRADATPAA